MNSQHRKTDATILTRSNAVRRKNLHLKYIALKSRRLNRSEPILTKSKENAEFHKNKLQKIKKTHVIVNRHVTRKDPQVLQKYPDALKKSPNVTKKLTDVKNVSKAQRVQTPITKLKTNDKLKVIAAKSGMKRALTKSKQKIRARTEQGGFTERVVSIWHYAKSFLGLSNSEQKQNTQNSPMEIKRSKQNLPVNITPVVKPKRAIYVVKKPLIHHNNKDSKELKNVSVNQHYHRCEKNFRNHKMIADGIKIPAVLPASKINTMNPNLDLQYENKSNFNKIEMIKHNALNNKPKKNLEIKTFTNQFLQHENQSAIVKANEKEQSEADKPILSKDNARKNITLAINNNQPLCEILNKANCYKPTSDETNATIIIELKNTPGTTPKDNKKIQPQTSNVNYAIQALDVHKNTGNCEKNVLTLLNTSNVKQNNITQFKKPVYSKVPINRIKKSSPKVIKIQRNLDKKKQCHHEDTKRRVRHKQHRSCKRHHYKTKYSHKHSCRHHKIKHIKRRKVSDCRGYISTDDSQQEKAHHDYNKAKYDNKELCRICKRRVTCLYHHNKKNHKYDRNHHEKKVMSHTHHKEPKSSKKHSPPKKIRSVHNVQKKKRTLTVCTNSRRSSFKNKKLKRSLTYIPTQMKPSISKIFPKFKYSSTNNSYINFQKLNSSLFRTDSDSDSDSDDQEVAKVLSWWYLHYAFNSIRPNSNDELPNQLDTEETRPFSIPYGDFCNVYEAISKINIDSNDSSSDDNWSEETIDFSKHPNSFTEEIMLPENIYPDASFYSSMHNFEGYKLYDTNSHTSMDSSLVNLDIPNNTPEKSTIDLQIEDDE